MMGRQGRVAAFVGLMCLLVASFANAQTPEAPPAPAAVESSASSEPSVDPSRLPHDLSPIGMFLGADHVVKGVIGGLATASVVTWAIFLMKLLELTGLRRRTIGSRRRIARVHSLGEAMKQVGRRNDPSARLVRAAVEEAEMSRGLPAEGIKERALSRFDRIEAGAAREMGRGTAFLASVGSLSPFVGLFGTVWGIMNSFIGISQSHTTNLAVVAPGIAEALLATAIGLVAAIPAVIIYNVFARSIAGYRALLSDASGEVLQHLSRDLERQERSAILNAPPAASTERSVPERSLPRAAMPSLRPAE